MFDSVNVGKATVQFNAITQGRSGVNYLANTHYKFSKSQNKADWEIKCISKDGKVLWTTIVDSPANRDDLSCDVTLATNGDVLVYGQMSTETLDGMVRSLPTVVRLDPNTGKVKKTEQTQTHFMNSHMMLETVPSLDMYVLGIYDLVEHGSNSVYFYRSRPSDNLSSLAMSVGLPRKMKTKRIVGMYFHQTTGAFSALLQPLESPGQNLALIYINKYSGTDITTGVLTTNKQIHYNQSANNIVAGRFDKNFTVFDFSGLK